MAQSHTDTVTSIAPTAGLIPLVRKEQSQGKGEKKYAIAIETGNQAAIRRADGLNSNTSVGELSESSCLNSFKFSTDLGRSTSVKMGITISQKWRNGLVYCHISR